MVIVVFGRERLESLSQVVAAKTCELGIVIKIAVKITPSSFMGLLLIGGGIDSQRRDRTEDTEGMALKVCAWRCDPSKSGVRHSVTEPLVTSHWWVASASGEACRPLSPCSNTVVIVIASGRYLETYAAESTGRLWPIAPVGREQSGTS